MKPLRDPQGFRLSLKTLLLNLQHFRLSLLRVLLVNPVALTLGTIGVVAALYAVGTPVLDATELHWLDLRFRARGPIAPTSSVVLAVIDEKSLDAEGRWPWPRSRIAALVDALSRDGARTIGFDIAFTEPDQNSRLDLVDDLERKVEALHLKNPQLAEFIRERRIDADNDRALARALERSSAATVLGYFFYMTETDAGHTLDPAAIERQLAGIADSKYPLVLYKDQAAAAVTFRTAYAPEGNLDMLATAAAASGFFSVPSDPDGLVRSMPLLIQGGDDLFPPLSVLCYWQYLGRPQLAVRVDANGVEGVQIGDRFVPTDEEGQMLINYRGPAKTFPHYSVSDILAGNLPHGTFKDKIVLVGATAIGIGDVRSTPFGPVYPGPEIQATVIDNIVTGDIIARPRWSMIFDFLGIVILPLLVAAALPRLSALGGLMFGVTLFGVYIGVAYQLFVRAHVWLNIVYPVTALAATYTILTVYRYLTEERVRRQIEATFKHYVSPDVIERMLSDPEQARLGGQERVLTVLFSDLAGFTSYSERYSPTEIIGILSEYYDRMTELVFASRGTLTAYVGDELMAIFGAPVEEVEHAKLGCAAALAMREARHALAEEWAKIGRPPLAARTGINSGAMLVGNYGSKYRFNYSVLGDQVNLASRLEQLNKAYGTDIMIGEQTAQMVGSDFVLRELDKVQVKGRRQALAIYELVATAGAALPAEQKQMLQLYATALEAYRQRRWDEAEGLFGQCLALWPTDGPSKVMQDRCRELREAPPPPDWDGTFEHLTKG
jgi:adenylate cyclase